MANNSEILGEEAAVRQIITGNFSATNGVFEDDTATSIRSYAFSWKNLKRAIFPNVKTVGENAFYYCGSNLEYVYLPEATTVNTGAFSYISSTSNRNASIILPKVTTLNGRGTFQRGGLYSVDLGSSLSQLSTDAFYTAGQYTAKVLSILILRRTESVVTAPSKDTVKGLNKVFVPSALIESYKTASNWSYYYNQTDGISFYPLEDYTVDGTTTGEFDYALLATPTNPMYAVTNLDVSVDENHQRYITTTAEGHITYSSGAFTSENWSAVCIQSDEVGQTGSVSGNYFSIPAGSTVTMVIKNMTATQWNNVSGMRNQVSVRMRRSGADLYNISWNEMKQAFYTDGLHRYEESYTNTGSSAINIVYIDLYGSLTPNNTLDFSLMVLLDGVRII